ncbi:MAG: class I SAM-dependent methyltransferase [Methanobacteriota archaeon]
MASRRGAGELYDEIAGHFDATRYKPWPETVEFLAGLPRGSLVLDAGCGNGRNALAAMDAGHEVIGFDVSDRMLCKAREKCGCGLVRADAGSAPFRSGAFDAALSIAVIHHIETEAGRLGALREIGRVLKPGGLALIGVWAREQERLAGACGEDGNAWVDWKTPDGVVRKRFYHLYAEGEFRGALAQAGLREVRYFFRCDNHYAVAEPARHENQGRKTDAF